MPMSPPALAPPFLHTDQNASPAPCVIKATLLFASVRRVAATAAAGLPSTVAAAASAPPPTSRFRRLSAPASSSNSRSSRSTKSSLTGEEAQHVDEVGIVEHRARAAVRRARLRAEHLVVLEVERAIVDEAPEAAAVDELLRERHRGDVAVVEPGRIRQA